jgi:hypothetical protein
MSKSQVKAMLFIFFNIKGIVHFEYITQGHSQPSLLCGNIGAAM